MIPRTRRTVAACFLAAAIPGATLLIAGPLDPPPGPVAPSHKTLTEVEPRIPLSQATAPGTATAMFRITQPGSYYLTDNIVGQSGKHGIEIAISGVSLDLMGFSLLGESGTLDGITGVVTGNVNISIRNGTLEFWRGDGIDLMTNAGNVHLEGVTCRNITGVGLKVGINSVVADCSAFSCAGGGIRTGDGCSVEASTARSGGTGFLVGDGSTVTACASTSNAGDGFSGAGAAFTGCTAADNAASGFALIGGSATNCAARSNSGSGFAVSSSAITGCTAGSNLLHGINAAESVIRGCTAAGNTRDGILAGAYCRIVDNLCSGNGFGGGDGAGIHVTAFPNHIEANTCTSADRGIDVDAHSNVIIRNTCSFNTTNWTVVANNHCLVVLAADAPAITGNSGGASPGSTNPNANYSAN